MIEEENGVRRIASGDFERVSVLRPDGSGFEFPFPAGVRLDENALIDLNVLVWDVAHITTPNQALGTCYKPFQTTAPPTTS